MSQGKHLGLKFRVQHGEGAPEELLVESERALIGSGAHCEVLLPAAIAAREQADVVIDGRTVRVRALVAEPMLTLGTQAVTESEWRKDAPLMISDTRIWVEVVETESAQKQRSPLLPLVLLPVFGAIALLVHLASAQTLRPAGIDEAPPLFDQQPVNCPSRDVRTNVAVGQERLRVALAKRERSPFWPRDGVEAVRLFEVAHACFAAAGHELAVPTQQMARRLREKIKEDYHARSVRLQHAYAVGDILAMDREVPALLSLLEGRSGPYVEWVIALGRFTRDETKALRDRRRLPGAR